MAWLGVGWSKTDDGDVAWFRSRALLGSRWCGSRSGPSPLGFANEIITWSTSRNQSGRDLELFCATNTTYHPHPTNFLNIQLIFVCAYVAGQLKTQLYVPGPTLDGIWHIVCATPFSLNSQFPTARSLLPSLKRRRNLTRSVCIYVARRKKKRIVTTHNPQQRSIYMAYPIQESTLEDVTAWDELVVDRLCEVSRADEGFARA